MKRINCIESYLLLFDLAVVCPRILKICDCTSEIKSACAEVFIKCNISTQAASHIAVQTVYNTLMFTDII